MLENILSASARKKVYATYAVIGIVIGCVQVGYSTGGEQPTWLNVVLAVFGFLGTAIGATAASNTNTGGEG